MTDGSKPPSVSGVAIGRSSVPRPALTLPSTCTSDGFCANGRAHEKACRSDAWKLSGVSGSGNFHARQLPARGRERRVGDHLRDRRDPGNRFLGELAERIRHRADEPAVDVDRAAAHAGDDAGVGQRPALEPREDQIAFRTDDVAEHAKDVDLELVEPVALEDRPADAGHAGLQLVQREEPALRRQPGREIEDERDESGAGAVIHGQTHG